MGEPSVVPAPGDAPFRVQRHASLASTMLEAQRLYALGEAHGVVVVAESQTAGRGRRGRSWYSPPGHLYLSAVVRLPLAPARSSGLSLDVGLAVAEAIDSLSLGVPPARLKWPNDVFLDGAAGEAPGKCAGVLVTVAGTGEAWTDLIVGIGVDVAPLDDEARSLGAVSLSDASGQVVPLADLEQAVLARLAARCQAFAARGGPDREPWLRRSTLLGRVAKVEEPGQAPQLGTVTGLADDGCLVVRFDDGERAVVAGDVTLVPGAV